MSRSWNTFRGIQSARSRTQAEFSDGRRESQILRIITDTCDKAGIPYFRNYPNKVVTTTAPDGSRGTILARIPEHQRGKPDLTVWLPAGSALQIETKAPAGKLAPDQQRWREIFEGLGHGYQAPRTIAEGHAVAEIIIKRGRK